jgi:hypothetical protein
MDSSNLAILTGDVTSGNVTHNTAGNDYESAPNPYWQQWETNEVASMGLQYSFTFFVWFLFVMACYFSIPVENESGQLSDRDQDQAENTMTKKYVSISPRLMTRGLVS